jgi:hypothetical protein
LASSGTTSSDVITAVVILGVVLLAAISLSTFWISRAVNNINRRFDRIETSSKENGRPTP